MDINELQNAALEAATEHIRGQRKENKLTKTKLYCITVFSCVLIICAAFVACFAIHSQQKTITEQQYALNMQYAGLLDLIYGAEITNETITNEADSGDGGTAVAGENNTVVWGDMRGES